MTKIDGNVDFVDEWARTDCEWCGKFSGEDRLCAECREIEAREEEARIQEEEEVVVQ